MKQQCSFLEWRFVCTNICVLDNHMDKHMTNTLYCLFDNFTILNYSYGKLISSLSGLNANQTHYANSSVKIRSRFHAP